MMSSKKDLKTYSIKDQLAANVSFTLWWDGATKEVAQTIGISQSNLRNICKGKGKYGCAVDFVARIAKFLDIPAGDLLLPSEEFKRKHPKLDRNQLD